MTASIASRIATLIALVWCTARCADAPSSVGSPLNDGSGADVGEAICTDPHLANPSGIAARRGTTQLASTAKRVCTEAERGPGRSVVPVTGSPGTDTYTDQLW
jgi:hypothetical protein